MILIFTSLLLILGFAYVGNKQDVMSPGVLITFSFLFSSCWALAYTKAWSLEPSVQTILVIILGVFEFVVVTFVISQVMDNSIIKNKGLYWVDVSKLKLVLVLLIEILITLIAISSIKRVTGVSNISDAIYVYRRTSLFSTHGFALPKMVYIGHYFCNAAGYFFGYILIKKLILLKKMDWLCIAVVVVSGYESTLYGSRTGLFMLLFGLVAYWYLLKRIYVGRQLKIKTKYYIMGAFGLTAFLATFKQLAILLGREVSASAFDYLAIYLGAEIKNLDIFISQNRFPITTDIAHSQTFIFLSSFLAKLFGKPFVSYKLDLPFQSVNGFNLGNVYTMFYQFLYDMGYAGVFIFTLLMAVIVQIIYSKAKAFRDNGKVSYSILLYGYIVNTFVLAFFSDKFYELVANSSFFYIVLFWVALNTLFYGSPKGIRTKQ